MKMSRRQRKLSQTSTFAKVKKTQLHLATIWMGGIERMEG
jgi:hypothetical protein